MQPPLVVVVVVVVVGGVGVVVVGVVGVVVVEYYIYLYILLLVRLTVAPHFFPRNNTCCTNYAYKRPGIPWPDRTGRSVPPCFFSSDRLPNVVFQLFQRRPARNLTYF